MRLRTQHGRRRRRRRPVWPEHWRRLLSSPTTSTTTKSTSFPCPTAGTSPPRAGSRNGAAFCRWCGSRLPRWAVRRWTVPDPHVAPWLTVCNYYSPAGTCRGQCGREECRRADRLTRRVRRPQGRFEKAFMSGGLTAFAHVLAIPLVPYFGSTLPRLPYIPVRLCKISSNLP
jgi:hypothetical protein